MPNLIAALAVSFFTMALVWIYLKPARLPLLTYFIAYTATTVVGAAALLDDTGLREFKLHQTMFRPEDYPLIGSPTYWILLLAPFAVVPVGAALGLRGADVKLVDRLAAFVAKEERSIVPLVYSIACACSVYCLWKLLSTGAYFPALFFDRTVFCDARIVRRAELFSELRYLYYAFAYAVIPIGATVALLSWTSTGRRFHGAMFAALLVAVVYFNVVLYMKASLVVVFLTLLLACIVARASFRLHIVMALLVVICLLLLQGLLGCYRNTFSEVSNSRVPVLSEWVSLQADHVAADTVRASALVLVAESKLVRPEGLARVADAAIIFVRSVVFRMAASLPYYVQVFHNPAERCGIESNSIPLLPRETCYPATKVGTHVNPGIMQAYQAAPAHINAYAELGLGYTFVVLILGGLILGFSWGVAQKAQSPLFWSAGAGVCVFGYYLTQAGFVGALTHSYGLVWYLFPIIAAAMIHWLARIVMSRLLPRSNIRVK